MAKKAWKFYHLYIVITKMEVIQKKYRNTLNKSIFYLTIINTYNKINNQKEREYVFW